jgi:hypothetical protein
VNEAKRCIGTAVGELSPKGAERVITFLRADPLALADLVGEGFAVIDGKVGRIEFAGCYDVPGEALVAYEDDYRPGNALPLYCFVAAEQEETT